MGKKRKKNNNHKYNQKKVTPIKEIKNSKNLKEKVKHINNQEHSNPEQQELNKDLLESVNNNNQNNSVKTFNSYDLDKKLTLEESKKNDIEKIFETNQKNIIKKKHNVYKLLSIILFLITIFLTVILAIVINKYKNFECEAVDCPIENDKNNQDNNNDNSKEETYLFLGDSIFYLYNTSDYFKDYNTINMGVNGITALETIKRVDESVYQYNPTTIFILLGTNDLYYDYTPIETFDHLKQLIDKIHLDRPEITINVLSILPINKSDDPKVSKEANANKTNEQINEVNASLRKYCEDNDFTYINVHDLMLNSNGELNLPYTNEGLHLTELGYHHITMELLKYMKK